MGIVRSERPMATRLLVRRATQSMRALSCQPRFRSAPRPANPIKFAAARFSSGGPERQLPMEPSTETSATPDEGLPTVGLQAYEQTLGDVGLDKNYSGPFGTKENPAIIESIYPSRVMCFMPGNNDPECDTHEEHAVEWVEIKAGETYTCPASGEVIMLKHVP